MYSQQFLPVDGLCWRAVEWSCGFFLLALASLQFDSHLEELMKTTNVHCPLYFILRTFQIASVLDKVQDNFQV